MIVKKNSLNKNKKKIENPKQTNKHYSDIQSSKHQVPVIQSFNHPKEKLDFFYYIFFSFWLLLCTSLFQITYIALVHCVCGQYKDKLEIDHHHHHHINRSIIKTFHENEKWNERIFSFRNSFFFLFFGVERFQTIFRQLEWWLCEDRTLNILDWMSYVTYDDFRLFYSFTAVCMCPLLQNVFI